MGVRSPHEATAQASRPIHLHFSGVQGRAMLPTRPISRQNRPHLIGTRSWRADFSDHGPTPRLAVWSVPEATDVSTTWRSIRPAIDCLSGNPAVGRTVDFLSRQDQRDIGQYPI